MKKRATVFIDINLDRWVTSQGIYKTSRTIPTRAPTPANTIVEHPSFTGKARRIASILQKQVGHRFQKQ